MTRSLLRALVAVAIVAALGVGLGASPQDPSATQDLSVGVLIDQAKVYAEQQRFAEALQFLQRAMTSIRRTQSMAAGVPLPPVGLPVRIGGDVKAPMKTLTVDPLYPADARAAGIQGRVILEAVINEAGEVADVKILRPLPPLDQAAIDAVSQWRYTPTTLYGVPVPVIMTVTVDFALN